MPETDQTQALEEMLRTHSEGTQATLRTLHKVALAHDCKFRVVPGEADGTQRVIYSQVKLALEPAGSEVTLSAEYDLRAFLEFYRGASDTRAKELLFEAAIPCSFCIDDKCTTLLTNRTITLGEKSKQLCGPYRHRVSFPVRPSDRGSAAAILAMLFRYCTPETQEDLFDDNRVSVRVEGAPERWVVGFRHPVNLLGVGAEQFIRESLARGADGQRKVDALLKATGQADPGRYVGVIDGFVSASRYDLVLGVLCDADKLPSTLPEGMARLRLVAGDYAVYNSSAGDYNSVWRHFTDRLYETNPVGFDAHRVPYEFYDSQGRFSDVHIPVSKDLPRHSGRYTRIAWTPDITVAGVLSCSEQDHPMYRDRAGLREKLLKHFPFAERIVGTSTHAELGVPMTHLLGVEVDKLNVIPEGLELHTLRGGYWNQTGYRHFTGGGGLHYELSFSFPTATRAHDLNHPRAFIDYSYTERGGLTEVLVPVRRACKHTTELVELPDLRVLGRQQAPPDEVVTPAQMRALYHLEGNPKPGCYTAALRYERHGDYWFFAKPIVIGVEAGDPTLSLDGAREYTVSGGRYVRISEELPNGEFDWFAPGYAFGEMQRETGHKLDVSRQFVVRQKEYGRRFELYAPVV
ncbi:MAG TPA: GyrI-like domain-containing protein [Armatimonadota bacterium]|jgi:hypothetical protein